MWHSLQRASVKALFRAWRRLLADWFTRLAMHKAVLTAQMALSGMQLGVAQVVCFMMVLIAALTQFVLLIEWLFGCYVAQTGLLGGIRRWISGLACRILLSLCWQSVFTGFWRLEGPFGDCSCQGWFGRDTGRFLHEENLILLTFEIGLESASFHFLAGLDFPLSLQLALLHLKPKLGPLLNRQASAPTVRHLGFQHRFVIIFLLLRLC